MRAVHYYSYGDPEVLIVEDTARPVPGDNEVLIAVAGTTYNPVDAGIRSGELAEVFPVTFPHTPGIDVSGTVAETGAGVDQVKVGAPVIAFLPMNSPGAAADYVIAPADAVVPAPQSVPLADAAALVVGGLTAWQSLHDLAGIRQGQKVLVNGAGGAVGGFSVQLAHRAGAQVTATAGDHSRARVNRQGADDVIGHLDLDGEEPGLPDASFDIVLNLVPVPPSHLAGLARLIVDGGILVSTTTPPEESLGRGVRGASEFLTEDPTELRHLVDLVDSGDLRIDIADHRPLGDLADVHSTALQGRLPGKTVMTPTW
jgi:NADPH:quinone reductase-like Zn-dependent oxidoreductase